MPPKDNDVVEVTEIVRAKGHRMIRATHTTTLEITKEHHLTARGDCIIAVGSDKSVLDLSPKFKKYARLSNSEIIIRIEAGGIVDSVRARGDPRLTFTHPTDIVVRRSSFVCGRTLAVKADKAAASLSRTLVEKLRDHGTDVKVFITVRAKR